MSTLCGYLFGDESMLTVPAFGKGLCRLWRMIGDLWGSECPLVHGAYSKNRGAYLRTENFTIAICNTYEFVDFFFRTISYGGFCPLLQNRSVTGYILTVLLYIGNCWRRGFLRKRQNRNSLFFNRCNFQKTEILAIIQQPQIWFFSCIDLSVVMRDGKEVGNGINLCIFWIFKWRDFPWRLSIRQS